MRQSRKGGFTLIEIMVVLVIAAIISTITFGAFKSIADGNKRTNCQSNLSQIYQSCRLYAQDFEGKFPYLNETAANVGAATPKGGLGLWSLYTFPKAVTANCSSTDLDLPQPTDDPALARSLAGYVRSNKVFHCPADNFKKTVKYGSGCTATAEVNSASFTFDVSGVKFMNPSYLSYQTSDDGTDTYSSFRTADTAALPVRQLTPFQVTAGVTQTPDRPTRDMTIVTWCRFHRKLDANGATVVSGRNYDNVLFYDGSVQNLPAVQNVVEASPGTGTGTCTGWNRVPRDKAESMKSAANCIPSP